MSNSCFRLILSLGLAAFVLPASFGQTPARPGQGDSFNSNSNTNADPCQQAYSQAIEKTQEHNTQVQAQWNRDLVDCIGNTSCVEQARQKRSTGERQVTKEVVDASAQRDTCEERRRVKGSISRTDPGIKGTGGGNSGTGGETGSVQPGRGGQGSTGGGGNQGRPIQGEVRTTGGGTGGGNPPGRGPGNGPGGSSRQKSATLPGDCVPPLPNALQQQVDAMAKESMRTMAGMGQQADIMITTMGKLAVGHLEALSHPNAVNDSIVSGGTAVVEYLNCILP